MALFRCGAGSAIEIIEAGKYITAGASASASFPFSFNAAAGSCFACVTGYTTLTGTFTGNQYIGLTGIKKDGTITQIKSGTTSEAASAIDISGFDYIFLSSASGSTAAVSYSLS